MEPKKSKITEIESRITVIRGWGTVGNGEILVKGTMFQLCKMSSGELIYSNVNIFIVGIISKYTHIPNIKVHTTNIYNFHLLIIPQ